MPLNRTAIILLNWNSYHHTQNCIYSLQQTVGEGFGLIVVDNGSDENPAHRLGKDFPKVHLICNAENLGFSGGNNVGIQYAIDQGYEYVMLLNNDVFVEPSSIDVLISYMDQHSAVGVVQPLIYNHPDRSRIWNAGGKFNRWTGNPVSIRNFNGIELPSQVDWITGCAFFARSSVFSQVGLLNEKYFAYYEDVDLSFRIKKAGYKLVFHPQSVIYHFTGGSSRASQKGDEGYLNPDVHYYNIRNHTWIIRSWMNFYERPFPILLHLIYSLSLIGYFLIRLRWNKFKFAVTGLKDGFASSWS